MTSAIGERCRSERGVSLLLVLVVTFFMSLLAASLLFTTEVELRTSDNNNDSLAALSDLDSAVAEVVYRLNLEAGATAPPTGSQISVNSLINYDAKLDPDPWDLLTNEVDDDADGLTDEVDELNFNRQWSVRIVLSGNDQNPGTPDEVVDGDALNGPPWGSTLIEPTIQPSATWREYSTSDYNSSEVLTMRFKLDTDTVIGDSEGDGAEIVFYDPTLVTNRREDMNTLTALGGDGDPDNDSPFNITWSDGVTEYPATGSPVLLLTTTAVVRRGGRVVATRDVDTEVAYPSRGVNSKAVCGCSDVVFNGNPYVDSYRSSEGPYGPLTYENGDIGSNGDLTIDGDIWGDAEAGGNVTGGDSVQHDVLAGGTITGDPDDEAFPNTIPSPAPCMCDAIDVDAAVAAAAADNNNGALPADCQGPDLVLNGGDTCTLDCGTYYYDNVDVIGNGQIIVGDTSCGPVLIYVSGSFDIAGNGIANGGIPSDLVIVASVDGNDVDLGGTSDFVGVVYAPKANVTLNGTTDIYGAVLGKNVANNGGAIVHYDEDLADLWRITYIYKNIAWNEAN